MNITLLRNTVATEAPAATVLVRLSVGGVFLPEGLMKLLYPEWLGAGRFADIGIPQPELFGPLVGGFELVCGLLILLGFLTRAAAIPLIVIMIVAIVSTKIPVLLGHDWWIFHVRELSQYGLAAFEHEWRTDFAMLCGALFLFIVGAGRWSADYRLQRSL